MLPERAFWPLSPRPAVLPRPEPGPRPTRLRLAGALRHLERVERHGDSPSSTGPRYERAAAFLRALRPAGAGASTRSQVDEVADLADHPHGRRRVAEDLRRVASASARSPVTVRRWDLRRCRAARLSQLDLRWRHVALAPGSRRRPCRDRRRCARGCGARLSPSIVAWMTLCGLRVPMHLVRMSCGRRHASRTARTAPPAMTPVPCRGRAEQHVGRRRSARSPRAGWWRRSSGTLNRFFLACSAPLRMASGTSLALPRPDAHVALAVADHDQRGEAEAPAALDDLGDAVDVDDAVLELEFVRVD